MTRHLIRLAAATISLAISMLPAHAAGNTMTGIFDSDFRTLTIGLEGSMLAPPVISSNSTDKLIIGFDALREDRDYLRYSIYHCDADWSISDMIDNEVFDGFNYADINDYAFSRATSTHYVHYSITLPNHDFNFRLSGNYLLQVYEENSPEKILLQARFMVSENAITIGGSITSRTDIDYNSSHQQLSFDVDLNQYNVRNPFSDLKVVVTQNGRVDNAVMINHPARVSGTRIFYEHQNELIFLAGNEYRRMETVQTTYPGMGVETIEFHSPYYHHMLSADLPRSAGKYSFDSTQHGRFLIREYNSDNSDTEADYTVVHFTLDKLVEPDLDIFIDGDFTYRHFDESSRMLYDPSEGIYHKEMLLKQGAYNYQYLAMPKDRKSADKSRQQFFNGVEFQASTAVIEGDFYQTVNEYFIGVYYRAPGERYDRLLGYTVLFSGS